MMSKLGKIVSEDLNTYVEIANHIILDKVSLVNIKKERFCRESNFGENGTV